MKIIIAVVAVLVLLVIGFPVTYNLYYAKKMGSLDKDFETIRPSLSRLMVNVEESAEYVRMGGLESEVLTVPETLVILTAANDEDANTLLFPLELTDQYNPLTKVKPDVGYYHPLRLMGRAWFHDDFSGFKLEEINYMDRAAAQLQKIRYLLIFERMDVTPARFEYSQEADGISIAGRNDAREYLVARPASITGRIYLFNIDGAYYGSAPVVATGAARIVVKNRFHAVVTEDESGMVWDPASREYIPRQQADPDLYTEKETLDLGSFRDRANRALTNDLEDAVMTEIRVILKRY